MSAFKENLLAGKTAFIAGGTSGINLGIAKRFAELGARVAVAGRNPEKAANAAASIGARRVGVQLRRARLRGDADRARKHRETIRRAGHRRLRRRGKFRGAGGGSVGQRLSHRGRYRSERHLQRVPRRVRSAAHAGRLVDRDQRRSSGAPHDAPGARLRGKGRSQSTDTRAGHGMGACRGCASTASRRARSPAPRAWRAWRRLPRSNGPSPSGSRCAAIGAIAEIAESAVFLCSDSAAYITGTILDCDGGSQLGDAR